MVEPPHADFTTHTNVGTLNSQAWGGCAGERIYNHNSANNWQFRGERLLAYLTTEQIADRLSLFTGKTQGSRLSDTLQTIIRVDDALSGSHHLTTKKSRVSQEVWQDRCGNGAFVYQNGAAFNVRVIGPDYSEKLDTPWMPMSDLRSVVSCQLITWPARPLCDQDTSGAGGGMVQCAQKGDHQQEAKGSRNTGRQRKGKGQRKRRAGSSRENDGDSDGDDDEDMSSRTKVPVYRDRNNKRFGCPLAKRYPDLAQRCHSRGGFRDTARVKEHIYRVHQVFQCIRCGEIFYRELDLNEHMLSTRPCEKVDDNEKPQLPQGSITQEQKKEMTKRKNLVNMTERERWYKIYGMVHPDVQPPYPSPYIESDPNNIGLQEYINLVREEIPRQIAREFGRPSNRFVVYMDGVPELMETRIEGILNNAMHAVANNLNGPRPPPAADGLPAWEQQEEQVRIEGIGHDFFPDNNPEPLIQGDAGEDYSPDLQFDPYDPGSYQQDPVQNTPEAMRHAEARLPLVLDPMLDHSPNTYDRITIPSDSGYTSRATGPTVPTEVDSYKMP